MACSTAAMSALRDSVDFFDAAPAAGPSCAGAGNDALFFDAAPAAGPSCAGAFTLLAGSLVLLPKNPFGQGFKPSFLLTVAGVCTGGGAGAAAGGCAGRVVGAGEGLCCSHNRATSQQGLG